MASLNTAAREIVAKVKTFCPRSVRNLWLKKENFGRIGGTVTQVKDFFKWESHSRVDLPLIHHQHQQRPVQWDVDDNGSSSSRPTQTPSNPYQHNSFLICISFSFLLPVYLSNCLLRVHIPGMKVWAKMGKRLGACIAYNSQVSNEEGLSEWKLLRIAERVNCQSSSLFRFLPGPKLAVTGKKIGKEWKYKKMFSSLQTW